MECQGFEALLAKSERFRRIVGSLHVLVASHHGRETGICPEMFDTWGCSPQLVVISDDCKQFSTQETVNYYANQATGISGFRVPGIRKVLTTRSDGEICFSFANGNCIVS
jgi:hypothetical protein